jgi:hypothetical protein
VARVASDCALPWQRLKKELVLAATMASNLPNEIRHLPTRFWVVEQAVAAITRTREKASNIDADIRRLQSEVGVLVAALAGGEAQRSEMPSARQAQRSSSGASRWPKARVQGHPQLT